MEKDWRTRYAEETPEAKDAFLEWFKAQPKSEQQRGYALKYKEWVSLGRPGYRGAVAVPPAAAALTPAQKIEAGQRITYAEFLTLQLEDTATYNKLVKNKNSENLLPADIPPGSKWEWTFDLATGWSWELTGLGEAPGGGVGGPGLGEVGELFDPAKVPSIPNTPGYHWEFNPSTARWVEVPGEAAGVAPGAMTDWQQWQTGFLPQQAAAEQALAQQRLALEQQNYLARLSAQPRSWLEYSMAAKEMPVIQPWMLPLMPQEYGLSVGMPMPGWPAQAGLGGAAPSGIPGGVTPQIGAGAIPQSGAGVGAGTTAATLPPGGIKAPTAETGYGMYLTPKGSSLASIQSAYGGLTAGLPTTSQYTSQYGMSQEMADAVAKGRALNNELLAYNEYIRQQANWDGDPQKDPVYNDPYSLQLSQQVQAASGDFAIAEKQNLINQVIAADPNLANSSYIQGLKQSIQDIAASPYYYPAAPAPAPPETTVPEPTVPTPSIATTGAYPLGGSEYYNKSIAGRYGLTAAEYANLMQRMNTPEMQAYKASLPSMTTEEFARTMGMTEAERLAYFEIPPPPAPAPPEEYAEPYQYGGIAGQYGPELALLGEQGPEAIVPLSWLNSLSQMRYQRPRTNVGTWMPSVASRKYPLGGMTGLARPSRQYQARIGPTALAQYAGYEQARTGITPEELQWRLWSMAPPGSGYRGLRWRR